VRRTLATRPNVRVTVLDALTYAGTKANLAGVLEQIDFVHGDVRDAELIENLVSESDQVVHFAAESHNDNSLSNPSPFVDTNILGTYQLIQACVKHQVRFHHVSTDEVFGDLEIGSPEKFHPDSPYNPSSPYSATKASSDLMVRAWVRSFGLQATISNCSNNFGPYQHQEKLIPRTILLAASNVKPKIYGEGLNVRDWIHVDDHNDGVWAVIERGRIGQTYLLGANGERSNLQVVSSILSALGKPADFIEFVTDRPGHDRRYAIDATATVAELGWEPKIGSLEAGLPSVIEFYLEKLANNQVDLSAISNSGLSVSAAKADVQTRSSETA
jgi:dTDP-glucose 4,6-dehydratase